MTALPGYGCLIRKSGVSTAIVEEPCAIQTASTGFRISASAKRLLDPSAGFSFVDNGATVAFASISSMDFLNGEVVFTAPLTSATSLVFNGSYLPITTSSDVFLEATSFKLALSRDMLDRTVFAGTTGGNGPYRARLAGLGDASLDVDSLATAADLATLASVQFAGNTVVVEVFFGDVNVERFRGLCQIANIDRSSSVEGRQETSIGFKIASTQEATTGQGFNTHYVFKIHP